MSENDITLVGNLTRDPELRYTTGGRGVVSFGLAVNRRYQSNGEWQEDTTFADCVAWGTLAENLAASATKGARLIVKGRLTSRSWEADDGTKRTKVEVTADEVGASFKWAQMAIEKTARTTPRPDDGYEQTAQQSSGQGGGGQPSLPYHEEEPFIRDADVTDRYM